MSWARSDGHSQLDTAGSCYFLKEYVILKGRQGFKALIEQWAAFKECLSRKIYFLKIMC